MRDRFMAWWKPARQDVMFGIVHEYRFPLLAWMWREFYYYVIHTPKIHIAHSWKRRRNRHLPPDLCGGDGTYPFVD